MTEQQIIENNRLIAEFMEYPPVNTERYNFNSDWNWLMAVVETIEEIRWESKDNRGLLSWTAYPFTVSIENRSACIKVDDEMAEFSSWKHGEGISKIKAVYLAVIEFINWYNKQQGIERK